MKFFDGLYSYEIVLLGLGAVLFVALLIAFLYLVFQGKPFLALLGFFLIPIAMIGYPSITSIQFKDGVVTISKQTAQLEQDPTNKSLRKSLDTAIARIQARPAASADTSVTLARAQFALGNETAAESNLQKALAASPNLLAAQNLKAKIALTPNLSTLATQVERNPEDAGARAELHKQLAVATSEPIANPETLAAVAHAQATVGNHEEALQTAKKALAIDPNSTAAKRVEIREQRGAAIGSTIGAIAGTQMAARLTSEVDTNRPGSDYRNFDLGEPRPELCSEACARDANCKAYTYVKPGVQENPEPRARCWLKSDTPNPVANSCCVSGVKRTVARRGLVQR